jgi:hypothetical protein
MTGRGIGTLVAAGVVALAMAFATTAGAQAKGKSSKASKKSGTCDQPDCGARSGKHCKSGKHGKSGRAPRSGKSRKHSSKSGKSRKHCDCTQPPVEPPAPAVCEPGMVPDVSVVTLDGGDVRIVAGPCANEVHIQPKGGSGNAEIVVPPGQSLNGVPGPARLDVTFTGSVQIDLGGGDDKLYFERVSVSGDVTIDTGEGDDFVRLFDIDVGGDLDVTCGQGDDSLTTTALRVVGSMTCDFGAGNNNVALDANAGGDMTLTSGAGNDGVALYDGTSAMGNVSIDVGDGDNAVRFKYGSGAGTDLEIFTGDGDDLVELLDCPPVGGSALIATHGGADRVVLEGGAIGGDLFIDTGSGADEVAIGPSTSPPNPCDLSVLGHTDIDLGRGDDSLSLGGLGSGASTFGGRFRADGGPGSDVRAELLGITYGVPPGYAHFEAVAMP